MTRPTVFSGTPNADMAALDYFGRAQYMTDLETGICELPEHYASHPRYDLGRAPPGVCSDTSLVEALNLLPGGINKVPGNTRNEGFCEGIDCTYPLP